ncbi:prenyltransferase [Streptomyces oryzae]|uniref:Prenyltransferase n=1 Tax=Streptomyces oryzae TaxID=1434886 RepID=A0ABS3X800_9ACTN|nr:prenyltransferase [Streptomyces oryzae]MBO8191486.1 prenyltransferase [Streptomyces oryzae]
MSATEPPGASVAPGTAAAFLRLARVKFLFQSMMVTGFGVTLAVHASGDFALSWYLLTLGFAWTTHLMTHFCNEYFDLEADRANPSPTAWTGGSRALVEGLLSPTVSLASAFVTLFTGIALTAAMPTLTTRLLAVALMALAWFYTAPPLRLNYHALGEVTCAAVLYGMGPVLAALLQSGSLSPLLLWCTALVCVLQVLRCLIMNLADIEGDRLVGKNTLASALGPRRLARLYAAGQGSLYTGVLALAAAGELPLVVAVAQLACAPAGLYVLRALRTGAMAERRRADGVTFWASMQLPLTTCGTMVALLADLALRGRPAPGLWVALAAGTTVAFAWWLARTALAARRRAAADALPGEPALAEGRAERA